MTPAGRTESSAAPQPSGAEPRPATIAGPAAAGWAMKDDRVANMARISPPRDPKLWRSRKLIVAGPSSVDHRSTPEVACPAGARHLCSFGLTTCVRLARSRGLDAGGRWSSLARFINKRDRRPSRRRRRPRPGAYVERCAF